jgi:electron transfer flavoprotein beta subunit
MNWPIANFASEIKKVGDKEFEVTREIDTGLQKIVVDAPCIISCDLRLNTPRYANLKAIAAVKFFAFKILFNHFRPRKNL